MPVNHLELEMEKLKLQSNTSQQLSEEFLRRARESNNAQKEVLEKVKRWSDDNPDVYDEE